MRQSSSLSLNKMNNFANQWIQSCPKAQLLFTFVSTLADFDFPTLCYICRSSWSVQGLVWFNFNILHLHLQANMASSALRISSMRFSQLARTSSPPTTSCGPSSCHRPVVVWTRRPHTLWREEMLATGRTRSTEWSGGWTKVKVRYRNTVSYSV